MTSAATADRDVGGPPISAATSAAAAGVAVGDHDAGALGGQPLGDGPADPGPAPVTSATRVASGLGFGSRASLASSSAQYSMRNFSDSGSARSVDTASAPRMTLIALT